MVFNDTKVIRARLLGRRVGADGSSGGKVEALLVREIEPGWWACLTRPSRRTRPGTSLEFAGGKICGLVEGAAEAGTKVVRFYSPGGGAVDRDALEEIGAVPLPPYIKAPLDRPDLYQTVYARNPGSVAAPTAGLHFTESVFDALRERGIEMCWITLHIGPGTFRPVRTEFAEEHEMDEERYFIPEESASLIAEAMKSKRRVVAVGTTVVRALESAASGGVVVPGAGRTKLFIRPGHRFLVVGAMVTNFHLPRSTLLMLVSAFAGRDNVLAAYREAIELKYRFYSFGDAMLIL